MIKKDEPQGSAPGQAAVQAAPPAAAPAQAPQPKPLPKQENDLIDLEALEGLTMADLLGPQTQRSRPGEPRPSPSASRSPAAQRVLDEFDFDEEAFLAALDEQDFVGTTGEVVKGTVIGLESDGVYVDIGGKAPG
ncbi:MAG: 30S ribosomal protein S1, partial [Cyanobacteriota bacterium]|nr:30S ribosomal protein S1 [Cyanobacteriota bacterium]